MYPNTYEAATILCIKQFNISFQCNHLYVPPAVGWHHMHGTVLMNTVNGAVKLKIPFTRWLFNFSPLHTEISFC